MATTEYQWDFFIAHASADKEQAENLYEMMSPHARVFVDSRCLLPGDDWDQELARAQQASSVTVVLISSTSERAYYQREEVASAIAMAREDETKHRVIPVYLDPAPKSVPYGLRLKHGLYVKSDGDLAPVSKRLLDLVCKPKTDTLSAAESPDKVQLLGIFRHLVDPFLIEILTEFYGSPAQMRSRLGDLIAAHVLIQESDAVFRGARFNFPDVPEDVIQRALTGVLSFIERRSRDVGGIRQCRNALALFERLSEHGRRLYAPRLFDVLDRPMKALGDKQLVERVASLCVTATSHLDRTKEEAECEARARICGLSWVYQRTGRLDLAAHEASRSLILSKEMEIGKNIAFCNKCLGRLSRMRAEQSSDDEETKVYLTKSIEYLSKAIETFSRLPWCGNEDPEVGDCHSLLARTYLVARDLNKAETHGKQASRRITDTASKDFLDLQILLGDLAVCRGREGQAIAYYTTVADTRIDDSDFQYSEIVARALSQRARTFSSSSPGKAIRDFRAAASIWAHHKEQNLLYEAEWQAISLSEKFPNAVKKLLDAEPAAHRVEAFTLFEQKREAKNEGTLSRRVGHDVLVWKQLLKKVREDIALRRKA